MPFIEPRAQDGQWVEKDSVTLTQLSDEAARRRHLKIRGKTYFLVDDTFGYTLRAAPFAAPLPEDLVLQNSSEHPNVTDLASVPRFLWGVIASYGHQTMPALLHDRRCQIAGEAGKWGYRFRRKTDEQFRQSLKEHSRTGLLTRWIMWSAVRMFGFAPLGAMVIIDGLWWWTFGALSLASVMIPARAVVVVATASTVLTLLCMLVRSREIRHNGLPARPVDDEPGFALVALGSQVGAAGVAMLAVGPLFPVVAVTVATNLALTAGNWISFVIAKIGRALHIELPAIGSAPSPGTPPRRQQEPPPRTSILPGL